MKGLACLTRLRQKANYLRVDDVLYFANTHERMGHTDLRSLLQIPKIRRMVEKFSSSGPLTRIDESVLQHTWFTLWTNYRSHRERYHREPNWIWSIPSHLRHPLRADYLSTNNEVDPLSLNPTLPYSGIGYHVWENGFTHRLSGAFRLDRLRHIGQLGFLSQPIIGEEESHIITMGFSHTRYVHVNDVRAIGKLILINNGIFPDTAEGKKMHVAYDTASATHDTLTPAGGDSTKGIDFVEFDEDLHYPELLAKIDFSSLPELTDDIVAELPDIIMNKGMLGMVLDIADKVAYLCQDLKAYLAPGHEEYAHYMIVDLVKRYPLICNVWETVRIDGDLVYFTDPVRLVHWLELRALMFSQLYQNPMARFWEQFVKTFVLEKLYKTGKVTADQLRSITDWELEVILWKEMGTNFYGRNLIGLHGERREGFDSLDEAESRKQELYEQGRVVCIIEKSFICKTGSHFLVKTKKGIVPLYEADPRIAAHLEDLIKPDKLFNVFYLDVLFEELPEPLQNWV